MIRAADQRVSDAERDEAVELLRNAAGEGRIGHDELEERLSRALSAKTYRQLNATIDDIPRPGSGRGGRGGRAGRVPQARRTVASWSLTAVRNEPWLLVFVIPMVMVTLALAAAAMMIWLVCIVAVLALGRHPAHPTHPLAGRGRRGRGPRSRGIAGSGWRSI
jgi:Domain of unknown function (DUF1707)